MKKNIIIISISAAVLAIGFFLYVKFNKKTGWVDLPVLIDSFDLKKDLEKQLTIAQTRSKQVLDTLEIEINDLRIKIQEQPSSVELRSLFAEKEKYKIEKTKQIEQELYEFATRSDEQILTSLNEYIKQYAEENNYKYIFGAKGNGMVMFAEEGGNITEQVSTYANKKFAEHE